MSKLSKHVIAYLTILMVLVPAAIALASTPSNPATTYNETTGGSRWTYKDKEDLSAKNEGSYAPFQNATTGSNDQGSYAEHYSFSDVFEGTDVGALGPHFGYDTTSNKCKTCHAVHRATGSFRLMRADNPDEACNYCHVGDTKHSTRGAYYRDTVGGVYAKNGHTMGSGKLIPDSSIKQWLAAKSIVSEDIDGNTVTASYTARQYNDTRLPMYFWTADRSSYHMNGLLRIGPTKLSCMSCHQQHNAQDLVWVPGRGTDLGLTGSGERFKYGYKLLRANPSGSTKSTARMAASATAQAIGGYFLTPTDPPALTQPSGLTTVLLRTRSGSMQAFKGDKIKLANAAGETQVVTIDAPVTVTNGATGTAVTFSTATTLDLDPEAHGGYYIGNVMKVPEGNINNTNTGSGTSAIGDGSDIHENQYTTWTTYRQTSNYRVWDTVAGNLVPKLSVWCADCHNLDAGHYESISGADSIAAFRGRNQMHSDRTHTSLRVLDCVGCHSSNMPVNDASYDDYMGAPVAGGASCAKCHAGYNATTATWYNNVRNVTPKSDFPHSGAPTGFKLLTEQSATQTTGYVTDSGNLDGLCTRCHNLVGKEM